MSKKREKGDKGWEENEKTKERIDRLKRSIDNIFEATKETREDMDRHYRHFCGDWWNKEKLKDNESRVFANYLYSTVMTIAPLITDNRPTWYVRAKQPYMQKYIDLISLGLEYLWDKLSMEQKLLEVNIDALLKKVGILKIYFCIADDTIGELRMEPVDPRTFFIAPGYDDIWDAPMCGEKKKRSLYWIRQRYPEKGRHVSPDDGDDENWYEREEYECHNKDATVYDIWMKSDEMEEVTIEIEQDNDEDEPPKTEKKNQKKYPKGKIVVFTKDVLLEEKPYVYDHGKPPYVSFYDVKLPHEFYGMGEGEQIEELNKSINVALQVFDGFVQQFCDPNWLLDAESQLDEEQIKSDLPGGGNVWSCRMRGNDNPMRQVEVKPVNRSVTDILNILPKIIEEVSGVTDVSKGMVSKTAEQSATEISTIAESSYTRTRQRVRNYEFSVSRVCYLCLSIMQQFYTEARNISIRKDDNIDFYQINNQKNFVEGMLKPEKPEGLEEMEPVDPRKQEYAQQENDYKEFISMFGDQDEIYADFDIEILLHRRIDGYGNVSTPGIIRVLSHFDIGAGHFLHRHGASDE